ncbi:histidinol-phosphate transaminase [Sporolactobacillus putidus]|uniref:Histidinol-phosphate aminotransferase n=1 Tax=Sporolactobacillus putidus TaxID=492735 RepID=A0A917W237_9BACL|nr:histidinol-phosphate transaminase [Sporolactobacillus putidus]GGL53482.1 histidinol-phosphate aminotransferase 1 [Sporolactobacillus putidus]
MFKENLANLRAYSPGPSVEEIKRTYGLKRLVKLDSNENVYGASPKVGEAIAQAALLPALYPDCRDQDVRSELSWMLNVREEQFLFGSGLDEIIVLISRTFLASGDNIVMAWPTFYEYYCHAQIEGAEPKKVPCDADGRHDLSGMLAAVDEATKVVWICNPNNPTGTYINDRELADFVEKVPEDVVIVLDEAYIDFVTAGDFPRSLDLLKDHPNIVVLRTFSKSFGLASFRIGYAIGQSRLIDEIDKVRPPFNNPRLSQVAAFAALQDIDFMKDCTRKNQEVLAMTTAFLDDRKIPYYPTQTNFIYIKAGDPKGVAEQCKKKGFLINPFQDGVRITIGKMDDMKELLAVLETALSETSSKPSI